MKKQSLTIIFALLFSLAIPILGYFYTGPLIAFLFLLGYIGGFVLWVTIGKKVAWSTIQIPYWTAFAIYIFLHKVEENRLKFFEALGDKITGIPVPEITPLLIIGLLILPIGAWVLIPALVKRGYDFGYYLAWTFFVSFGVIESAHFIFPLLTGESYRYFPGMASAIILVPAGWWGVWRLIRKDK